MLKIVMCVLVLCCTELSFSQVWVKLKSPPMNRLAVKDMWNLTVRNLGPREITLYLEGTVDEATDGRIVEGTSGTFSLKGSESRDITVNTIPGGGNYSWPNRKYQEVILRTNTAPSGEYTICVNAKNVRGDPLSHDCIQHTIAIMSPPVLVAPVDGEVLPEGQVPTFTWTPPMPSPRDARYRLRLTEVFGTQSVREAIQRNPAVLDNDDIRTTMFRYPASARRLESNKKYAWRIEYAEVQSEIWTFTVSSTHDCAALSAEFNKSMKGDTCFLQLGMLNNSTAGPGSSTGKSFRVLLKNDSIATISGRDPAGWTRIPEKLPPRAASVTWTTTTGAIPMGKTDFGTLGIVRATSETLRVVYEWLSAAGEVICRDSSAFEMTRAEFHYVLSKDRHQPCVDVAGDTLNVQYVNNYASGRHVTFSITEAESRERVAPASRKNDANSKTGSASLLTSYHGVNRIAVNLQEYALRPGKVYILRVSDAKSDYYFSFRRGRQP